MQLLDSDWPANILAGAHFRTQENGLMSPDGVCAISVGLAGHKTIFFAAIYLFGNLFFLPLSLFAAPFLHIYLSFAIMIGHARVRALYQF